MGHVRRRSTHWRLTSIGARITAFALAIAVVAGLLAGANAIRSGQTALRAEIFKKNLAVADLVANLAADYVEAEQLAAREFASRPSISVAIGTGQFPTATLELARFLESHPRLNAVSLVDPRGTVRATGALNSTVVGTSVAERDWFRAVRATGQPFLGLPSLSPITGRPIAPYAVPVIGELDEMRGMVIIGIALGTLTDAIGQVDVGPRGRVRLVEARRDGIILSDPDPSRFLQPVSRDNAATQLALNGERGAIETAASSGEATLTAFTPVAGLPWSVLVVQPLSDALAPIEEATGAAALQLLAVIAFASAGAALLAVQITRPIEHLYGAAQRIAAGDYSVRVNLADTTELGVLGQAFDRMAAALEEQTRQREQVEQALRASEERYRAVAEMSLDYAYSFRQDAEGRLRREWVTGSFTELTGYPAESVITLGDMARLIHPDDRTTAMIHFRLARAGRDDTAELRIVTRDGGVRWVRSYVQPVRGADDAEITGIYGAALDITAHKQNEAMLAQQALHDPLTGLPNRILFEDRLRTALRAADRQNTPITVFMIDLDKFKPVNDTRGHPAGDAVLRETARRLREALRSSDTVARVGGDEFAVLLPEADGIEEATLIAGRVRDAVIAPVLIESAAVTVGVSIGIARYPADGAEANDLLQRADAAMYAAKRAGGGVALARDLQPETETAATPG